MGFRTIENDEKHHFGNYGPEGQGFESLTACQKSHWFFVKSVGFLLFLSGFVFAGIFESHKNRTRIAQALKTRGCRKGVFMASIRENRKDGKLISYTFTACFGRDRQGKQIRRYKNWTPPKGMTPAKASKEAKKQAEIWEKELRENAEKETTPEQQTPVEIRTPDERSTDERQIDFVEFIDKVWFPLRVSGNDRKAKTVQFYESAIKIIKSYFAGRTLQEITVLDISYSSTLYSSKNFFIFIFSFSFFLFCLSLSFCTQYTNQGDLPCTFT